MSERGGPKTKLLSFKDSVEFIMVLPGVGAREFRKQFATIITRYAAGDMTLQAEIEANAESNSPIPQMARASLVVDPVNKQVLMDLKRKRAELECAKLEVEIKSAAYQHITKVATSYRELCVDKAMDERARQIFKDHLLSKAMLQGEPSTTNNKPASPTKSVKAAEPTKKLPVNAPISISAGKQPYMGQHHDYSDEDCYPCEDDEYDECIYEIHEIDDYDE